MQSSALEEPSAAAFLHQNYLDSFLEIDDLAETASYLSDANVLVDAQRRRPWQTPLLPYVASLAGRGLVTHNRHPAPSRFTQTRKPQLFAVEREALERKRRAARAFQRPEANGFVESCCMSSAALTSEMLPFLRLIISQNQRGGQQQHLTAEQFQSVMELSTFARAGGGPGPPPLAVYRPLPPPQASQHEAGAAALDDEIEG